MESFNETIQTPGRKTSSRVRGVFSNIDRKKPLVKIFLMFATLVLLLGSLAIIAPVVWMVLGSFKTPAEIYAIPQSYFPANCKIDNYAQAIRLVSFGKYFFNSLFICICVVVGQLLISSMAAYSISKLRMKFGGGILLLFTTSLMVPFEVLIIPLYLILKYFPFGEQVGHLNLIDTYWGMILPSIFSAFTIIVLKDFFDSIPNELLYAARIDGCGELRVFFRFILPMAKPIMSILGIFSFVTTWNSFFWPLIIINNPDYYPLVLGVQKLIDTGEPWNVVMAALVLCTIPSVILLVLFQRTIIRGIAYTGIYG